MKIISLILFSILLSSCTSTSPRSVVYESTSFEGCADMGAGVSGTKFGNAVKNIFGGSSMMVCKNVDVYDEPVVIEKKKKQ